MNDSLVILGGGGHAKVLIDLIKQSGTYKIAGILDPKLKKGESILGVSVLGDDSLLKNILKEGIRDICLGIGKVGASNIRKNTYEKVKLLGFDIPALVHPQAVVSESVHVSQGVQVMAGAVIQADSFLDKNVIVNTAVLVDHDCKIGQNVHLSPGSIISGGCVIGDNSFIGAGATVIHGIRVGKNVVVGAGAVVVKDVKDGRVVKGVPAR